MQEHLVKYCIFLISHSRSCFLFWNFLSISYSAFQSTELKKFLRKSWTISLSLTRNLWISLSSYGHHVIRKNAEGVQLTVIETWKTWPGTKACRDCEYVVFHNLPLHGSLPQSGKYSLSLYLLGTRQENSAKFAERKFLVILKPNLITRLESQWNSFHKIKWILLFKKQIPKPWKPKDGWRTLPEVRWTIACSSPPCQICTAVAAMMV